MKPKAVIFDLDGTLLDTLKDLGTAVNTVLKNNGFPIHPLGAYRYFVGSGVGYMLEQALPSSERGPENIQKYVDAFSVYYTVHWADFTRPYKGISDMLHKLTVSGVPISVLSNKPHNFAKKCVATLLGDIPFSFVWGHKDEYPRKPQPDSALALSGLLGLKVDEIMFVGDSDIDMQTATRSGMYAAGVSWGFRTVDELEKNGAKTIFNKPLEIINFLG